MLGLLAALLINWVILFALCFIVTEYGQGYLYDEVTPNVWPKIAIGSLVLSALLVYTHSTFDTMFTTGIGMTVLQGIVWFLVFMFIFQFHPGHAAAIGVILMVLATGLASMAVDSFKESIDPVTKEQLPRYDAKAQGLRKSASGPLSPEAVKAALEKAQAQELEKKAAEPAKP